MLLLIVFSAREPVPPSLIHEGGWRKFRRSIEALNLNILKIILSFAPPPPKTLVKLRLWKEAS
jgi:hypothetical protein